MSSRRMMRLNELLKRDVSARLLSDVKDPRIGFVTVLSAEIFHDYTSADICVSVLEEDKVASTLKALNRMRGFFQRDLSKTLGIRLTPILTFKCNTGIKHSVDMEHLIEKARRTDTDHQKQDHPPESEDQIALEGDPAEKEDPRDS
jgi:ribosome-binding factor A